MSRIYPLPTTLKAKLIDLFCPENFREEKMSLFPKEYHLARLLLGRAEPEVGRTAPQKFCDSYNFPLTRIRAEKLGIDTEWSSPEMGRTLARMHMTARNDFRDIEVVLGANITSTENKFRESCVWVIGFNQVEEFNFTEEQIPLLVDTFYANEAYSPRARPADPLYNILAEAYRSECQKIGEKANELGQKFIVALEAKQGCSDKSRVSAQVDLESLLPPMRSK